MGFRQTNNKRNSDWSRFVEANRELFLSLGLPHLVLQDLHAFDYLLLHGYVGGWEPYTPFSVDELTDEQMPLLIELAERYCEAGFPGGHESASVLSREEVQLCARQYLGFMGPRVIQWLARQDEANADAP